MSGFIWSYKRLWAGICNTCIVPKAGQSAPSFQPKTKPALRIVSMSDGEAIGKLLLLDRAVVVAPWVCPLLQRSSLFVRKLKGVYTQ